MDRQSLRRLSRLSRTAGRDRRVQRQVHGQPDGAARRLRRHAARTMYARPIATSSRPMRAGCSAAFAWRRICDERARLLALDRVELADREEFRDAVLAGLVAHAARHSGQVPLRRARLGAVRRDLRAAGILPHAHRDRASCGAARPSIARLRRAGLRAGRVRQRLERQDAAAARRHARPRGLCADRHLAPASRRDGRASCGATIPGCGSSRCAPTTWRSTHLPIDVNGAPRLGFFPGSTIGNLEPHEATAFLRRARAPAGRRGAMVLGVDLKKDPQRLHDAYNDCGRRDRAFTLNLLRRMNRELDATFDLAGFAHDAFYNPVEGRIEIYFRSLRAQTVTVAGRTLRLRRRRARPHRVFLQVRRRRHRGAGAERRLHDRPDLDRSRPSVRRHLPGSGSLKTGSPPPRFPRERA